MAHLLKKIRKRSTFIKIRKNGILQRGKAFNVEFLNAENFWLKILAYHKFLRL